jgi:hypothetical protein
MLRQGFLGLRLSDMSVHCQVRGTFSPGLLQDDYRRHPREGSDA